MLPPGVSSDLGCGDLGGWASQDVAEDVVGFEGRAGWSFGVESEVVFGLDVEVGAFAGSRCRNVEGFAGEGVVDEDVCGLDGASLGAGGGGGVGQLDVPGDVVVGEPNGPTGSIG